MFCNPAAPARPRGIPGLRPVAHSQCWRVQLRPSSCLHLANGLHTAIASWFSHTTPCNVRGIYFLLHNAWPFLHEWHTFGAVRSACKHKTLACCACVCLNLLTCNTIGLANFTCSVQVQPQGQFQHYRHAAPMLLFFRGNSHTRGNIWKFSVESLKSCGPCGCAGHPWPEPCVLCKVTGVNQSCKNSKMQTQNTGLQAWQCDVLGQDCRHGKLQPRSCSPPISVAHRTARTRGTRRIAFPLISHNCISFNKISNMLRYVYEKTPHNNIRGTQNGAYTGHNGHCRAPLNAHSFIFV